VSIKVNKQLKTHLSIFCGAFVLILTLGSCKKDKKEDNAPSPSAPVNATGTYMFHLHTYIDNNEVDLYNIPYTTDAGRDISLSLAQLYISDIQLVKQDGSTYEVSGKKILKVFEFESYFVGEVPVGAYKTIRFKVGLDATTNGLLPSQSPDSAILNKPAMWFGTSPQPDGYVFLNVQGTIDTSSTMSGMFAPFVYKIGTNANYKQVQMPDRNFTISEGQIYFGHIMIDYNQLFNGVMLNQASNLNISNAGDNASSIATTIVDNIPAMFIYEP